MSYDPNYQQWAPQPPRPPKKNTAGKIAAIGCGSVVALIVFGGFVAAITSSDDDGPKNASSAAPAATKDTPLPKHTATKPTKKHTPAPVKKPDVVTFKVWGNAPAGALGSLDISYGSDSDSRKGSFKNGTFTATLPLDKDALYYTLNAQLQGSGDINCSVTVDGKTKKGHASGGYNICDAQLSPGLLGGWD
jgi:hypothetical protein